LSDFSFCVTKKSIVASNSHITEIASLLSANKNATASDTRESAIAAVV